MGAWALSHASASPVIGLIVATKAYDTLVIEEDGSRPVLIHPVLFPLRHAIELVGAAAAVVLESLALHEIGRSPEETRGGAMARTAIVLAIVLTLVSMPWKWSAWWFVDSWVRSLGSDAGPAGYRRTRSPARPRPH